MDFTTLPEEREDLEHCSRCGLCLSVCPTYQDTRLETQSPRGRVAMIRAVLHGELSPGENFRQQMYHCLYCRACETACPSGIKAGQRVVDARSQLFKGRGLLEDVFLKQVLASPRRLELSFWPWRLYQGLPLAGLRRGLSHLLPSLGKLEALFTPLEDRPLRVPEVSLPRGEKKHRVGFFLGCVMSLLFPQASAATLRLLAEGGCEVFTPRNLRCCGALQLSHGEREAARGLARANIDLFESRQVEAVVTDCAACGATLKEYAKLLAEDPVYKEKAQAFSRRVRDISEFLLQIGLPPPKGEGAGLVTYHDPCHLAHAQGIRKEPRQLLRLVPGLKLKEMREADWCCGSAGIYNLTHPARSQRFLERKMRNIQDTGAPLVVTANPGCLLQLRWGARRQGGKLRVMHLTELLDQAYRAGQSHEAA